MLRRPRRALAASVVVTVALALIGGTAGAHYTPGEPPGVDPGTPPWAGAANPIPAEPAAFDPSQNQLQSILDADVAAGGSSYWFDRILARPFSSADSNSLMTRGRALYMYTHQPSTLGFAGTGTGANGGGGYAYRQPPTTSVVNLYTITVSGGGLAETTAQRMQFPSYYSALFTRAGLSVAEKKFITDNDVAVTDLTLTNTGTAATSLTLTAASPIATTASTDGTELTGNVGLRYGLSTFQPRMSGDGFAVSGTSLTRAVSLDPGASVTVKVQLGAIAAELAESATDYQRYRAFDPNTAWLTQMFEYNKFWVSNVPYLDIPDKNVEKISYYRLWENRFNLFDGNIPGNDYQFPADLEGALGYNNQISLTVPMRLQDLQFYRDPIYSYGPILSQGEESGCQAFHDNPGNGGNWSNTYEQWTGAQAWETYQVHGGPKSVLQKLAKYSECDLKGMLAKFDTNNNGLIEYSSGTLPGNDADSVAYKYFGTRPQDRTESSYWYAEAKTAGAEYSALGNTAKADEMNQIADRIKNAILNTLWANGPVTNSPTGGTTGCNDTGPRVTGKIGNALKLCGSAEYVTLPAGTVNGLSDFSISVWINPSATPTWSRVFDFGTGTSVYMFLTVNAGSGPRFAITTAGSGGEQQLNSAGQLPLNTWTHLAVTLSGTTGTLYINGNPVAANANMTLHPSNLGSTGNTWIGRSQFADPFLNATVDDFQIYNRALSADEVTTLAAGSAGAGNVASYAFDEASGATATDSSGNGRNATIVANTKPTITCPGQTFLQKDLTTGSLVCWKDQQNFAPFIDGVPPNTDQYKQALRYYADPKEFPLFPVYTANQADQAADIACSACGQGTNNFSNINETLQARLFSTAIRDYPSPYITPDMYWQMIEWQAWNEDINGDNRLPDNNEFFFTWNPTTKTLGRSGIHHDVLGSFNWMMYQDIAGLTPRLDNQLEMWPIDMGLDHFAMNNLSYHGSNLTIVWQKPGGTTFYPAAPMGYSVYVNGQLAFTVDDLVHLTWNSTTGAVQFPDGGDPQVLSHSAMPLAAADQVDLSGNPRIVDSLQKAGLDLTGPVGLSKNLALGKTATASFSTSSPASQATNPANAVDGFTISGSPVTSGAYVGTNPIWGDMGSPSAQDWLQVDLGSPVRIGDVKLYFYDNKTFVGGNGTAAGNTYRTPTSYTVQYFDGAAWHDVANPAKSPANPTPNVNDVTFTPVTTRLVRVMVTRPSGFGVGIKEMQVYNAIPQPCTTTITGTHSGPVIADGVTCLIGATVTGPVTVRPDASLVATDSTINGPVSASAARQILLDNVTITGSLALTNTTGAVSIDDGSNVNGPVSITGTGGGVTLGGAHVNGPVNLTANRGPVAVVLAQNVITGPVPCNRNDPAPVNIAIPNTIGGPAIGQCAGL
jgi:hypothetical protein